MKKLIFKIIQFILMIIAPVIAGKALYEYVLVKFLNQKPTFPFGSKIMQTIEVQHIEYLSNYTQQMLSIGVVFLAITVLIYLSILVKALVNLAKAALVLFLIYCFYYLTKYY